jgi:hypothetical protein
VSIYLEPPAHDPRGPDGQGWNRLSLNAHMGRPAGRCALRPRTYPTLWESMRNTAHCRWEWGSGYARCHRQGRCGDCPVLAAAPRTYHAAAAQVLVRIRELGEPSDLIPGGIRSELWLMEHPKGDRETPGQRWSWDEIRRLDGWRIGRAHRDARSAGFWIHKIDAAAPDGLPALRHGPV